MDFATLDPLAAKNRRVLLRLDLNVPLNSEGQITDFNRIDRAIPSIEALQSAGARLIILSHLGRPKGREVPQFSLAPVAEALRDRLGLPLDFLRDRVGPAAQAAVTALAPGQIVLLENLRFDAGEEANDPDYTRALASLGEIFVHDAFATAHRAHASTEGLAHHLPAYAGLLMQAELTALHQAMDGAARPLCAIVGGAKVSSKFDLLANLITKVDRLVIGGGMANTFLAARGVNVEASLYEPELVPRALELMQRAETLGCALFLPLDLVAAEAFDARAAHQVVGLEEIPPGYMVLDFGPRSIAALKRDLADCRTVIWNGPLGAFELPPFATATFTLLESLAARSRAGEVTSVLGGGDTVAALNQTGLADDMSYVSTAGGAFLEWMEGKALPGLVALAQNRPA